jgi:hypothetical protein
MITGGKTLSMEQFWPSGIIVGVVNSSGEAETAAFLAAREADPHRDNAFSPSHDVPILLPGHCCLSSGERGGRAPNRTTLRAQFVPNTPRHCVHSRLFGVSRFLCRIRKPPGQSPSGSVFKAGRSSSMPRRTQKPAEPLNDG